MSFSQNRNTTTIIIVVSGRTTPYFTAHINQRSIPLEEKIKHRPVKKIQQWRKRYAKPLLDELWLWMEKHKDATPPGSLLSKAINYALSRRWQLSRFLKDGALPLDNNACERAIRPVVMGRKSWLFAGSLMAGERAVQIMSRVVPGKSSSQERHETEYHRTSVLIRGRLC
jgi:hypothetical protein